MASLVHSAAHSFQEMALQTHTLRNGLQSESGTLAGK